MIVDGSVGRARLAALVSLLPLLLLPQLLGTCGSTPATSRRDGGADEVPCSPGKPFALSGRFGVLATLNEHVEVLGLDLEDPNPQAELLLIVDLAQQELDVGVTALVCDIKIPEIQLKGQPRPIIFRPGPNVLASVPPVPGAATLSGDRTCAAFANPEPLAVVLGARLVDPARDALPTDGATQGCGGDPLSACASAPATGCVCDQEGDGHPGSTLSIENAPVIPDLDAVYVTLRTTVLLAGEVYTSDLIRGTVDSTLEQTILDCHRLSGPCDSAAAGAIRNINPSIEQDPIYPSTFVAKRIDDAWDCLRLVAERNDLFPQ
jgi:hypothetical protein